MNLLNHSNKLFLKINWISFAEIMRIRTCVKRNTYSTICKSQFAYECIHILVQVQFTVFLRYADLIGHCSICRCLCCLLYMCETNYWMLLSRYYSLADDQKHADLIGSYSIWGSICYILYPWDKENIAWIAVFG